MRRLVGTLLVVVALCSSCERPLVVRADPTGTEKQPLRGKMEVQGTTTRALKLGDKIVPRGTSVVVEETWLLREKGGGYRVGGLYDPATQTDGLMLPKGSIDVVFFSAVLPERKVRIPVPQEAFAPAAR